MSPRLFYIMLVFILLVSSDAAAQKRTAKSIKREQQVTQQEIQETSQKIRTNTAKTKRSLNQLNLIEAEISSHERTISNLNNDLDSINKRLKLLQDSIKDTENKIIGLKKNYSNAIRNIQARSSSFDRMLFIFSANSFNQAYRRIRYLQQFSEWREKQTQEIQKIQVRLKEQQLSANKYYKQRSASLAKQNTERLTLVKKRKQQSNVVSTLKKEGKELQRILAEKQRQARLLDEALTKLIAEEERKAALRAKQEEEKRLAQNKKDKSNDSKTNKKSTTAIKKEPESKKNIASVKTSTGYQMSDAERELSGSFESNKGRLLFPVSGQYKIVRPFGRHKHPELKYVQTDNGGIDIEVPSGTNARAVFDGKVSAVFRQDGFNTIVMVRHGNYLTIYVNLSEIYVSNGESVKVNQKIGKIFSDPEDDNRTILHFEVRKEREKLNPQLWVK